eukprot:TRINITY_DN2548_c0_g1_i1.p1 TRINITY_DN2548_c0_g1~~TRINITY_DN2548_c0_g1_i1.p1  ORF type:complete len:458 (+),score=166.49 TRINITY_DN2548_c0_g1_i1:60-1376(+)
MPARKRTATKPKHEEELLEDNLGEYEDLAFEAENASELESEDEDLHAAQSISFRDMYLKSELLTAIQEAGFEHPSPIQQDAIPQAVVGSDLLCQAKAGTGKTAVFVFSMLNSIELEDTENPLTRGIVICHTRELAHQVANEFKRFSTHLPHLTVETFYGGVPFSQNEETIKTKNPVIVVGTPGRLKELVEKEVLDLSHITHFVLDECDHLLAELKIRRDVQQIFLKTPPNKQVWMFSATIPEEVKETARLFLNNPVEIAVDDPHKLVLYGITQYKWKMERKQKFDALLQILDGCQYNQIIIFVRSFQVARSLTRRLMKKNHTALTLHSRMPQPKRIEIFQKFKNFGEKILVATDLMGRGIDLENVNIVVNFDMPRSEDEYMHRVGRTGRFSTEGTTVSFLASDEDVELFNKIQGRFKFEVNEWEMELPPIEEDKKETD